MTIALRSAWTPDLRRDAYVVVCAVVDAYLVAQMLGGWPVGGDALSWHSVNLAGLYGQATQSLEGSGAFRYAPIVGQALAPLAAVPWLVFLAGFATVQVAVLVAMARERWWLALLFPPVVVELYAGNVELLMAAAIVASFRWPAAWSFLLLTKVTPGVGVLWFAFRREWRSLAIALAATGAIVGFGVALAPDLWAAWIRALVEMSALPNPTPWPPLVARLPFALALLWWAARGDRRWAVPIVALLAMPTIWAVSPALLAGTVALWPRLDPAAGTDSKSPGS